MTDFESRRLELYEDHLADIADKIDTSHGDFVYPSFTRSVAVDDGYREADLLVEITVANSVDRTLVIMASTIRDGQREIVEDIGVEDALSRARQYASNIEDGGYYGVTDGEQIHVASLDQDVRFEQTCIRRNNLQYRRNRSRSQYRDLRNIRRHKNCNRNRRPDLQQSNARTRTTNNPRHRKHAVKKAITPINNDS